MPRVHIIYIPGLGKGFDLLRRAALLTWQIRKNVTVELVPMDWGDAHETFADKRARVLHCIGARRSDKVIVVGESAGGAVALSLLNADRQVHRVVTICGKNRHPETIGSDFIRKYPAFYDAVRTSDAAIRKVSHEQVKRICVAYSVFDATVTPRDTRIEDTEELVVRSRGHFRSISLILLCRFAAIRGSDAS